MALRLNFSKILFKKKANDEKNDENIMSLKQAKFDVFKYGIKGLSKEDQETAKMQIAIKLGAKPMKNKCLNYKELMQHKKEEKERKAQLLKENKLFELKVEQARSSAFGSNKPKIGHLNKKSRINKGEVGKIKGHIGTYVDGMLKLSKNDMRKMNLLGKKK
jgi:hypothetical protein